MKTVADLELAYLPMEEPSFASDPWPHFSAARQTHPWLAQCAFGYVVHQYEAVKDLMWMDDRMRPAQDMIATIMGADDASPWGRMVVRGIAALTGDDHIRLRNIVTPLFTPKQAKLNQQLMRDVMTRLLDEWAPKGAFDFEEFISYFPIAVVCGMIGAPAGEIGRMRHSLETLGLQFSMNPEILPELQTATVEIDEFGQQVVADRRAGKVPEIGGELLDVLLKATGEGGMSERELYDLLIFLFAAGYDTSKNMMTWIMHNLLDKPDMYQRCAEDFSYCQKVVEESFRYQSVANAFRLTSEDIEYQDTLIPAGTMLFFPLSVLGRDPEAFPDADTYNPERVHENRHMGFGRGRHLCLGQFIARAQIAEGMHLIAQRLKNPKRAGDMSWRPFFGVWGLNGLPIEFEDAA